MLQLGKPFSTDHGKLRLPGLLKNVFSSRVITHGGLSGPGEVTAEITADQIGHSPDLLLSVFRNPAVKFRKKNFSGTAVFQAVQQFADDHEAFRNDS